MTPDAIVLEDGQDAEATADRETGLEEHDEHAPEAHPRRWAGFARRRSSAAVRGGQGKSWRSTNRTFAGRSASRRMYHGYQASPYAIRFRTR